MLTCPALPTDRRDFQSRDDVRDVILESINRYVRANLGTRSRDHREYRRGTRLQRESHLRAVFRDGSA